MRTLFGAMGLVLAAAALSIPAQPGYAMSCWRHYWLDVNECAELPTVYERSVCGLEALVALIDCLQMGHE